MKDSVSINKILMTNCYIVILPNSSLNFEFIILILVPFIPRDLDSITPALSSFLKALTITDLVIPDLSAILLATRRPSFPSSSANICCTASISEYERVPIAICTIAICLSSSSRSRDFLLWISNPITAAPYSPKTKSSSLNLGEYLVSINVPHLSPPPKIGITV